MSITVPRPASSVEQSTPDGVRTYRGRSLADLIPQIRAELGADAIILREREGLIGGVGGFFAKRCIEVEARRAARIDVYDDHEDDFDDFDEDDDEELMPAEPLPPRRASAPVPTPVAANGTPSIESLLKDDHSFADQLLAAQDDPEDEVGKPEDEVDELEDALAAPAPEPAAVEEIAAAEPVRTSVTDLVRVKPIETAPAPAETTPVKTRKRSKALARSGRSKSTQPVAPGGLAGIARGLMSQGIGESAAARLVTEAAAHGGPFAMSGDPREAVRRTLANSLPRPATLPAEGATIAFVGAGGAGKTRATASLASAYKRASMLSVGVVSLGAADRGRELKELLKPERIEVKSVSSAGKSGLRGKRGATGSMTIVDTPAVAPSDQAAVRSLASELGSLGLDAIYVAIPATLGAQAARQLLDGLMPLSPSGIIITHADETDQIGVAVELAGSRGIPVAYIHEGLELGSAISSPDPTDIAKRLVQ